MRFDDDIMPLNKKQKSALRALELAFKKCKTSGIYFHNCYGRLIAYDKTLVDDVRDADISEYDEEKPNCGSGYSVEQSGYCIDSWADDYHVIDLTPKGKRVFSDLEEEWEGD